MQRLFKIFLIYKTTVFFVLLQIISAWLIVQNNNYTGSKFFNTSNSVVSSILTKNNEINQYFDLDEINESLAEENRRLRHQIYLLNNKPNSPKDTTSTNLKAEVVDNTIFLRNNYITINKGYRDSVKVGMGVVGQKGIVGQVIQVSNNYALVLSLLHNKTIVSSIHQKSKSLCSVVWNGKNPSYAQVKYLSKHVKIIVGDTISTSGFNSIYEKDKLIGIVSEINQSGNPSYYDIEIKLSTDFKKLSYVYLVDKKGKSEQQLLRASYKNKIKDED